MNTDELRARYEHCAATPSDINQHLRTFVQTCVHLNAKAVIELGVRWGTSTIAWLYGLSQTDGRLWSVDVSPKPDLEDRRWTFIQGDDLEPGVVLQTPSNVDVVFIDTTHSYEQTLAELELYIPKVRDGGRVLLHDTEVETPEGVVDDPPFPVMRAVDAFCHNNGLCWTNHPHNNGLGIIKV